MAAIVDWYGEKRISHCCHVVIWASEIPGVFMAQNLDLDLVTQGNSRKHALQMIREASLMALQSDREWGHDSWSRRAPEPVFEDMRSRRNPDATYERLVLLFPLHQQDS